MPKRYHVFSNLNSLSALDSGSLADFLARGGQSLLLMLDHD